MLRSLVVVSLAASAALLAACGTSANLDATSLLRQSEAAMGGAALKSIQFTTRGSGSTFGQAFESGMAWPRL
ncbi:MAG: hypothetical protein Q8L92_16470, partial [Rubrivivax sp.]|nr:hypothetical protein [Rubrivivax sp.]